MLDKIIKLLGGVPKDSILTEAVKDLYNTIDENDILKQVGGFWTSGGKEVPDTVMRNLRNEAHMILNSSVWKELKKDIKYKANQKMFLQSKDEMDLVAGKLWLYTLDCIENKLINLSKDRK